MLLQIAGYVAVVELVAAAGVIAFAAREMSRYRYLMHQHADDH
jgi:hypothetical protein